MICSAKNPFRYRIVIRIGARSASIRSLGTSERRNKYCTFSEINLLDQNLWSLICCEFYAIILHPDPTDRTVFRLSWLLSDQPVPFLDYPDFSRTNLYRSRLSIISIPSWFDHSWLVITLFWFSPISTFSVPFKHNPDSLRSWPYRTVMQIIQESYPLTTTMSAKTSQAQAAESEVTVAVAVEPTGSGSRL